MQSMVRPAAVAGLFYPAAANALEQLVKQLLVDAEVISLPSRPPRAFVVPHAGFIYSGPVAAAAYRMLGVGLAENGWRRIVMLGPNHRLPLRGMAVSGEDNWQTPLGSAKIDLSFIHSLRLRFNLPINNDVHLPEHSLEVQLPFLQQVAKGCALVPVLVGQSDREEVAQLIEYCLGDPENLVLISSDMSHYHSYDEARRLDAITDSMICKKQSILESDQACGCHALNGLLLAAERQQLEIKCLSRMSSGDTAGDQSRVVGYGAYVCY